MLSDLKFQTMSPLRKTSHDAFAKRKQEIKALYVK